MWPAGRQLRALLWKNWLCRRRHPVLSLAEFFWPCILFMILTILRFQEPPRHRDNCYLQPRDLPSRGVFPFVRSLLCNTGARCRGTSYAGSTEHHFRSSRFQTAAGHHRAINDLVFLQEMQDLADEICETMDKATNLQQLWVERSKIPGSSYGSNFLTVSVIAEVGRNMVFRDRVIDLNKTEEVISKLESLYQQPQIWDFLLLLPRLYTNEVDIHDGIRGGVHLLQAILNSLTSLEDLDWPPLNPSLAGLSKIMLNMTISTLTFLQEHGVATAESGYSPSLRSMVRDPQKVQADLKSQFGFDDLRVEQIMNYSPDLKEIPTESSLERMVCSVLSQTSEDEADGKGHPGDCHPRWSAAKTYLVQAVSWLRVYKQVFRQWQEGSLRPEVLAGASRRLEALWSQLQGGSPPRGLAGASRAAQLLLGLSAAAVGPRGSRRSPKMVFKTTKDLLMMERKLHTLENEQVGFLLLFVEFLEELLSPDPLDSSGGPSKASVNTSHLWVNHSESLEREPSGTITQKLLEFSKEMIEKLHTLKKKEPSYVLRFLETILFHTDPELLELWVNDISKGGRANLETLSVLLNFSIVESEKILSKSFNFSQFFHSGWPQSSAVEMDFVHLSETVMNSLSELGFLRQEQVSAALDTVYAVKNASALFAALSQPQKQDMEDILTHIYLNVFKDKDSALLLQIYSSFYQYVYKFLGIQSRESLLSFLKQTSKHVLDIMKQFNYQNVGKVFSFLYETIEFLGGISEVSYCQQLLSIFNFLELQAQSLMTTESPELEVVHAALTGLQQLLIVDEDFRISLFQYVNQYLNSSGGALLGNECFALDNKGMSLVNYSVGRGPPFTFPWNLSADGSELSGLTAAHCAISWLQMWTEIWGGLGELLKLDRNVFAPLHVGLTQLLDELESNVEISKSCQGVFPIPHLAGHLLNLLTNITQGGGFRDWGDFLSLRDLWAALHDVLARVKSLHLDQVENSLSTMETVMSQLKALPLNASAGREFLCSLLDIFMDLSNTSEYRDWHTQLINHFLSNNRTKFQVNFESIFTDLRETILFLRNVSHDQDLLSCAAIFQNITELISEDGLFHVNTSQRTLRILAMLKSSFSSEGAISRLKGCIDWVDITNHLYVTYSPSFSQGHLPGVLRNFRDVENKINSTLTLVTWLLHIMESGCSLNKSNINCVNVYLKNITDFLNVLLTTVFERENVPKFEILLALFNDSTNEVRMIISNLTRDLDFASQSSWKHFAELILRPIEVSDEIPSQFQNTWLHVVALGKDIQEFVKDIFPNVLGKFSSKVEKFVNIFTTSPKEKDIDRVGNSFFNLASYLAFNLSHDLQNSPRIIPREVMKAVGLGIQLMRDVFNSLMPSVRHSIPEDPGNNQVLKKVTSFLLTLRKADIDLLVDQLEQVGESLMDFLKNISRSDTDSLRITLLVGLMEKFVDSSHSWNVNHLLRLSRLFPREDVDAMVGVYYALPHAVRLLHGLVDKNVTEALKDVYDFTVLHGTAIFNVTKEDLTVVIKTLLDTIEVISDKPDILAKALTCLPMVWCRERTTGFQQNPKLEACNGHFYNKVASILDHFRLSPPGDVSQCANDSSQVEITKKMVCVIHELADWSSILLELSEVFHVKTSLVKTVQEFWHRVLPSLPSFGSKSNGSISGLCPSGPMKQVALQIMEKLKNVNFTKVTSDKNILYKLAILNKFLNNAGTEASLRNISLNLERIMKLFSGDQSLENSMHYVVSLFLKFLNANLAGRNFEALSSFTKKTEATYNFEDLWLESEQIMKKLNHDLNSRTLFSEINKDIKMINSVALQNITLPLAHFLERLNSSSYQALETTEDFLSVTKNWLQKYANEEHFRMMQVLFLLMANESSSDNIALFTKVTTTFLGYLKNISRGGDFAVDLLTHLVNQEQPTNFSVVQSLLESFLIKSVNNLAASSQEAAWNLSDSDLQIMNLINLTLNQTKSEKGERVILPPGSMVEFMEQLLKTFFTFLEKENSDNRISLWLKDFHSDITAEGSVAQMCRDARQPVKLPAALVTLQRAKMLVLRVLLAFAENPSWARGAVCAAVSCRAGAGRRLAVSALRGLAALPELHQELEQMWSLPLQVSCEGLSRSVSGALEHFRSSLENATARDCVCPPAWDWAPQRLLTAFAQSLEKTLFSGNSIATFLSNFTVTAEVAVSELVKNVTALAEELRALPLSEATVSSVLEAHLARSQVLPSALTVALSGTCDQGVLRLLLAFPEGEKSRFAAKELCGLPGAEVYSLMVSVGRNLDLRGLIYKTLMPAEAGGMLSSLLDVISRLNQLLPKASHVLGHLPEFLHALEITALLAAPARPQGSSQAVHSDQTRSSAFGSLQSVMKMICKEQASLLSDSNMFLNLPRVNEVLGEEREKFNIPEDSTPFCLKLYQEILQSPNGALVWSFLRPILHGKILYTPDTPEVNRVIEKANHTFIFVDKLRTLSETLLSMSSTFQSIGNGQMLHQLQEVLRIKFIRHFVESQLHIDIDKLTEKLQKYGGNLGRMLSRVDAARVLSLGRTVANLSSCVALDRFQGLESVAALEAAARELMQENGFLASVIFNSSSAGRASRAGSQPLPPHVTYTIRTSVLYSMRTDLVKNPFWKFHPQSLPADGFKYNYVFAPLQDMLERAIILVQTGQEAAGLATQTQAIPYPCHSSDLFLNNVGFFLPLIMMLTWTVSVASMVRKLVYEREIQIEEYLRMMGVHPATPFLAWFLENVAVMALSSAALAAVLKTSGIFAHSDALVVFLFLLDFGVSVIMLSYALSALFSQANTAALCTSLVYMISFLPYIVLLVLRSQLGAAVQTLLCLLSTTAFGQGVFFITFLEGQEAGVHWGNMGQSPEQVGTTFGWVCGMMLLDSGLYFLCGWYLTSLIPGTFAVRKPWYFPFTMSYWKGACGWLARRRHALCPRLFSLHKDVDLEGPSPPGGMGTRDGGPRGVSLVSVTKEHQRGRPAVRDLTLTFHSGQITALLGTNGAGKTTVISMLTGLYPPTSGTVLVNGRSLQADLPAARKELGVCPQRDILFDSLTVLEHLLLFAAIKSPQWTRAERRQHVSKALRDVGLTQHQHTQARALSGGLRRRLSVGAAFLGASSTVVLDEPTSGVDPCSRRSIWDILLRYREELSHDAAVKTGKDVFQNFRRWWKEKTGGGEKTEQAESETVPAPEGPVTPELALIQTRPAAFPAALSGANEEDGRTVIFTTHHLDEAEALSDHVAVLHRGRLRCCGPPLCLTEAHGQGLSLTLTKQPSILEAAELKDIACTTALIQTYVPQAFFKGRRGRELSYAIARDADRAGFKGLFQALEQNRHRLHLAGCGVSDTTLEQVFLKLLQDPQEQRDAAPGAGWELQNHRSAQRAPGGFRGARAGTLTQVAALLTRRLCRARRAWRGTLLSLLLPVLFVALAMGLFMVRPLAVDYPPLQLTPGRYEKAETYFFSSSDSDDMDLAHVLLQKFGAEELPCADLSPGRDGPSCWRVDPPSRPEGWRSCGCLPCPNASAWVPYLTSRLGHTLLNLSAFPLEHYLLLPSQTPRLGGWSFGVRVPDPGQDVNPNLSKPQNLAKVWHNQKGFHSLPSYLNHLNNLILWRLLPAAADRSQYGITLYSHPYGGGLLNEDKILESIRQCGVALCIVLGISILSASIGSSVVRDRATGAKRLQHISGLGYGTYWLANFLYDMLFYSVSISLCVAVIVAFRLPAFTARENLAATALLLGLFGYATLPGMYLMSRVFSGPDVAFITYISLSFVFGLCTLLMTTTPRLLAIVSRAQSLRRIYDVLKWVFTVFPQFCLGQGLIELCYNQVQFDLTRSLGVDAYASPFAMSFLGWVFVQLASQGTVLLGLRLLLHRDRLRRPRSRSAIQGTVTSCKDPDVEKEQLRVLKGRTREDFLVLCNLSKSYGRTVAVQDVTVGIRRGECFGLLGVNGAGKSTTFKMLSGDVPPTTGHAIIRTPAGEDVALFSAGAAGVRIGYCPQQDALDELLTGWEHLRYYCRLRGIPKPHVPEVAGGLVRRLHLEAHVDKLVATYSGGTKRKLSVALALLGKPDLLLLDEPSSGMDPCSKRYLWKTITEEVLGGCAVVLTSHSMEECEALCTRLAIMVDGSFRCLGSPQHIKNRFSDGYTIKVWVCEAGSRPEAVSDCLKLHFPGIQFKGQRLNLLEYHVPRTWECLADLFRVLEDNKALLDIQHYSVHQTTLEQVFIDFATEQPPLAPAPPGAPSDGPPASPLPV